MRFRKKPVEVEAVRFTGDNGEELRQWTENRFTTNPRELEAGWDAAVYDFLHETWVGVKRGQWIICGVKGEFYPCDDEVLHETYDEVPQ